MYLHTKNQHVYVLDYREPNAYATDLQDLLKSYESGSNEHSVVSINLATLDALCDGELLGDWEVSQDTVEVVYNTIKGYLED